MKIDMSSLPKAVGFGVVSIALYVFMFLNADQLVEYALLTQQGEKIYFVVPIIIAFVFSYVHGAFTGYFWDTLGLKAAKKLPTKKTTTTT